MDHIAFAVPIHVIRGWVSLVQIFKRDMSSVSDGFMAMAMVDGGWRTLLANILIQCTRMKYSQIS